MTRLNWGAIGERFYEAGVDHGVLYLDGVDGVPWNGLTSIKEAPTGGDPTPYYIDGIKYLNIASAEEFSGSIDAFSSPAAFAACDGSSQLAYGLFITQQPRKSFSLSYRTKRGNDISGLEYGYKLHLVYNALASPASRDNATLGENSTPGVSSWSITTLPVTAGGNRRSAHFVIDSTLADPTKLSALEDILYGTDVTPPRLPQSTELIALFS